MLEPKRRRRQRQPLIATQRFSDAFCLRIHRVSEKRAFLFLLELCQISTNVNKFW